MSKALPNHLVTFGHREPPRCWTARCMRCTHGRWGSGHPAGSPMPAAGSVGFRSLAAGVLGAKEARGAQGPTKGQPMSQMTPTCSPRMNRAGLGLVPQIWVLSVHCSSPGKGSAGSPDPRQVFRLSSALPAARQHGSCSPDPDPGQGRGLSGCPVRLAAFRTAPTPPSGTSSPTFLARWVQSSSTPFLLFEGAFRPGNRGEVCTQPAAPTWKPRLELLGVEGTGHAVSQAHGFLSTW